jgi:hypothetical protein
MTNYQLPLELWTEVIEYALLSPLLYPLKDDLLHNTRLLRHDCETFLYGEQMARCRLRLVCRTWNEVISRFPWRQTCWRGSRWPVSLLIPVPRIEFEPYRTFHQCHCRVSANPPISDNSECSVEAVIEVNPINQSVKEVLKRFPNPRILSLSRSSDRANFQRIIFSNFTLWCDVTHLRLPPIWAHLFEDHYNENLYLAHLHTLSIDLTQKEDYISILRRFSTAHYLCYCDWSMPNLKNVEIIGMLDQHSKSREFLNSRIDMLLEKVGSTLQGFAYLLQWEKREETPNLPTGLWKYCTGIKTIHGHFIDIAAEMPPDFLECPIDIILHDFDDPPYHQRKTWLVERDSISLSLHRFLKLANANLSMDISWLNLQNWIIKNSTYNPEYVGMLLWAFDRLGNFKDRHDDWMSSEAGQRFMTCLKSYCQILLNPFGESHLLELGGT